jgi:hypothetical protein
MLKVAMRRVLPGLFAATAVMMAQAVDLTAPALQANADISENWGGEQKIAGALTKGQASAASMGVPWQGLRIKLIDEPSEYSSKSVLALFQGLACMADAIVVGHTDTWLTHLSGWQNSLYSDYDFVIDSLLKDSSTAHIGHKTDIVVTRLGGDALFSEGQLDFNDTRFPRFEAGKTYLLLLKYIPASSSFTAIGAWSTLVLRGDQWMILREAYAGAFIEGFAHGTLESSIARWLPSCK